MFDLASWRDPIKGNVKKHPPICDCLSARPERQSPGVIKGDEYAMLLSENKLSSLNMVWPLCRFW